MFACFLYKLRCIVLVENPISGNFKDALLTLFFGCKVLKTQFQGQSNIVSVAMLLENRIITDLYG